MTTLATFLVASGSEGDLLYVVAVVLFGVIGAIVNKLKERGSASTPGRDATEDAPKERPEPARPRPVSRPGPASRPMPLPRPVIRENMPPAPRPATAGPRPPKPPVRPAAKPGPAVGKPVPQRPAARPQPPKPVEAVAPKATRPQARPLAQDEEEFVQPIVEPADRLKTALKQTTLAVSARQPRGLLAALGRTELRRAIVLNELLGPPLGLRDAW